MLLTAAACILPSYAIVPPVTCHINEFANATLISVFEVGGRANKTEAVSVDDSPIFAMSSAADANIRERTLSNAKTAESYYKKGSRNK